MKKNALYIILTIITSILAILASTLMLIFTLIVNVIEAVYLVFKEYFESLISQFLGVKEMTILKTKHEESIKTLKAVDDYCSQMIHELSKEDVNKETVEHIQQQLNNMKYQLNDLKPKDDGK